MPSTKTYREWRAQGLCGQCGKADAVPGRSMCAPCAQANAARVTGAARKRREQGLCGRCRAPVADGKYQCAACNAASLGRLARLAEERRAQGLCARCGLPSVKYACPACLALQAASHAKQRRAAGAEPRKLKGSRAPKRWNVSAGGVRVRVRATTEALARERGLEQLRAQHGAEPTGVTNERARRGLIIGSARVRLRYHPAGKCYSGAIIVGPHRWEFEEIVPPPSSPHAPNSGAAREEIACYAVRFALMTHTDPRPSWAPSPEVADAIEAAVAKARIAGGWFTVVRKAYRAAK